MKPLRPLLIVAIASAVGGCMGEGSMTDTTMDAAVQPDAPEDVAVGDDAISDADGSDGLMQDDAAEDAGSIMCTPGEVHPCPRGDGTLGCHMCTTDGMSFGVCIACNTDGGAGGAAGGQSGTGGAPATGGRSGTGGAAGAANTGGASGAGGSMVRICDPGDSQGCMCPDGRNGAKVCNQNGSAFGPCMCSGPLPATGGRSGSGGAVGTGGAVSTGGMTGTGGAPSTGGRSGTGGAASGGAPGTGGSSSCYAAVTYKYTTPGGALFRDVSIYHEATNAQGQPLPRTPPYGPFDGTLGGQQFVRSIAKDDAAGTTACYVSSGSSVACTVHVPCGSTVRANAWYAGTGINWACSSPSGRVDGTFNTPLVNGTPASVTIAPDPMTPGPTGLCVFQFSVP